jgi:anti-anti-sigma regulatory factor
MAVQQHGCEVYRAVDDVIVRLHGELLAVDLTEVIERIDEEARRPGVSVVLDLRDVPEVPANLLDALSRYRRSGRDIRIEGSPAVVDAMPV